MIFSVENIGENYTRYNDDVDSATAQRLLNLNRQFYTEHGRDFSATRERLQPGVRRIVDALNGDEAILDIGCGNGELARTLSRRGHRGSYLGLDFSLPLLQQAERAPLDFPAKFLQVDLTLLSVETAIPRALPFDAVFAFAILHHIPTAGLRESILEKVHTSLKPEGHFVLSNWQFLESPRSKSKIQHWTTIGLIEQDVDPGDYLLDWKRGGKGLRYVHHFDEAELAKLAHGCGFEIIETFYSDGENKRSGLYQVWVKI